MVGAEAPHDPVEKMDVKPGGAWRFVSRSPDGEQSPCGDGDTRARS